MTDRPTHLECLADEASVRICPDDDCGAHNSWLPGQREPLICRACDGHLCCVACGEVAKLDDAGRCAECTTPRVTVLTAELGEFGLTLVERKSA